MRRLHCKKLFNSLLMCGATKGKLYSLPLILCLLVASETGGRNEFEWSDRVDSPSCCCPGRAVWTAPNGHAVPDDVLQRASARGCLTSGRDPGHIFCEMGSKASLWSRTQTLTHATRTGGSCSSGDRWHNAASHHAGSLNPCISSVVMRWPRASSCGTAMYRSKRMRSARSSHC